MRTQAADFHHVEDKHRAIDERLRNWSRWCYSGTTGATAPIWRMVKTDLAVRGDCNASTNPRPVDILDATKIQKAVSQLPPKHRASINWQYVLWSNPRRKAKELAVSLDGLRELVRDGRQMLINRGT